MYVVNLLFCVAILTLGIRAYKTTGSKGPLIVGIGFALFGISHLAYILGIAKVSPIDNILVGIRTGGYLAIIYALAGKY
ncbi:MAG: hypothetical protein HZC10_05540 [Nitrospirae bacterium]|nr:hypothetical protein [Nitrospirota bacterium]